jgi:hypothetical protein
MRNISYHDKVLLFAIFFFFSQQARIAKLRKQEEAITTMHIISSKILANLAVRMLEDTDLVVSSSY